MMQYSAPYRQLSLNPWSETSLTLTRFSQNPIPENHSYQSTSDSHNFRYGQAMDKIWKGLEPRFHIISKPKKGFCWTEYKYSVYWYWPEL